MSEFKGTKGSWRFNEVDFSVTTKGDYKNPTEICHVMDNNPYDGVCEEDVANGHIIAAAPELLDLVQRANGKNGCHTVAWQEKAKQVLAKALGQ